MKQEVIPAVETVALAVTPMTMLQMAVQQGADLDKLQKLMDLQERWEAAEARKAFVVALSAFKANPPELTKNKDVKFGATEYSHATLDHVSLAIGKALSAHGLSHRWDVEQKDAAITVACVLTHEKGHSERVQMSATADTSGSKNSIQAIGSTVTYLSRYTLLAATGMAAGPDDDGAGSGKGAGLSESAYADFEAAIDSLADVHGAEELWKVIAAACFEKKDKAANDSLKAKITAKGKELKKGAK